MSSGAAASSAAGAVLSLLRDVADVLFDPCCAAGEHPLGALPGPACAACLRRLQAEAVPSRCASCSMALSAGASCIPCAAGRRVRVLAPRPHAGTARALVLALKAARREEAAALLASATFQDGGAREALLAADLVVPVPSHAVRRRERGFNPAEAIATELARLAGARLGRRLPVLDVLSARGSEGKQSSRSAAQRRRLMRGTFRVGLLARRSLAGRSVVLVDDVVTTGATIAEASAALLRAGASDVAVVACTRAEGTLLDAPRTVRRLP